MPWIPTGGGGDPDAIHDNVAGEIEALTEVTPVTGDWVLIEDASDSDNKKKVDADHFLGGGGGGGGGGVREGRVTDGTTTALLLPGLQSPTELGAFAVEFGIDAIRYYPIILQESLAITGLAAEIVANAGAGRLARLALYEADNEWQPGARRGEGEIDLSTTGVKTVSVATTLAPGRYVLATRANHGSPTFRYHRHQIPGNFLLGGNFIAGLERPGFTYGTLPDPGLAYTAVLTAATSLHGIRYSVYLTA